MSQQQTALKNRLQKNLKKLKTYVSKHQLKAYRLYQKDIPEYPYLIDLYGEKVVVYEQGKRLSEEEDKLREKHQEDIRSVLQEVLGVPTERQFFKIRERQKGNEQYRPLDPRSSDFFIIDEPPFKFWVNLERYLDTGLFLDHRPLRQHLLANSAGKKVLNLFCYTGSLSVASAKGGGRITSVDMSRTYLDWARENFLINELDPKGHDFVQADVLKELQELKETKRKFDLILLDPPSFSNSKRMEEDLDIERDHPILVRDCMQLLTPEGELYFSTNKRRFELHDLVTNHYEVREISQWTIPQDFQGSEIHRSFRIKHKKN